MISWFVFERTDINLDFYAGYVNDFALFLHRGNFNALLTEFNSIQTKSQFTIETETEER